MNTMTVADYEHTSPFGQNQKTNFYYSFSFLPKDEREAINTFYSFCREIDDIVDESPSSEAHVILRKRERLAWWRAEIEHCYSGNSVNPLMLPLFSVINRFAIPKQYFLTVIDGCERDLLQNRYETFADLKEYCYSVASVVGLASIEIFGYKYEETKEYAINLGYALQLTNIIRDVKVDKDRGYIYIPKEDLERFKYSEADLMNEVYNDNFIELMRFQARRAREYYGKARMALRPDERVTMFAAEIMDAIYYRLLEKIELSDF
ncbi:MAG TPA: squalene/phytoene synthase family protein, partial [Patescibacteria group bacterium]|nr:squalene/phytoene synthase family protein [Patescibacteria group bacterium]